MSNATKVPPYVAAATIAEVVGVSFTVLENSIRPPAWASPRDFHWDGRRILYTVASLPELLEPLKAAGHVAGAAALLDYLGTLGEQAGGYEAGAAGLGKLKATEHLAATAEKINEAAAKFGRKHASDGEELPKNWMQEFEEERA